MYPSLIPLKQHGPAWNSEIFYAHRGLLPCPKWQVPRIGGRPWSYTGQLPSQLANHRWRRLQRSRHQMEVTYSGPWLRPENTLRDTNQRIWRSPHETTRQGTHQGRKHPRPVCHQSLRISHLCPDHPRVRRPQHSDCRFRHQAKTLQKAQENSIPVVQSCMGYPKGENHEVSTGFSANVCWKGCRL